MVETSFKNIIRGRISQPAGKRFLHKTETDTFCALFDVVYLTFFIWISPTSFWIQIDCFLQFYDQIPPSDHQQLFLQPCKLSVHQFFFLVVIFSYLRKSGLVLTSLAPDCTDYRTGSDELHASRPWIFHWISIHLYPIWFWPTPQNISCSNYVLSTFSKKFTPESDWSLSLLQGLRSCNENIEKMTLYEKLQYSWVPILESCNR